MPGALPAEVKRRRGRTPDTDSGGRRLPDRRSLVALRMADGVPEPPAALGLEGLTLWRQAWSEAVVWLSPETDMRAVVEAAFLVDDVAAARKRYRATTDPADARSLVGLSKSLSEALSGLGFNPTARARLGVAEVRAQSSLESLLEKRRNA